MSAELGLRVDVCNHRALERGVPRLREILARAGVRATFFVAFGPDQSGRNLLRLLEPGFAAKMLRTRAPRLYGAKTLLYGTLLPGPPVGESFPDELRALRDAGHELGIHGFGHVRWQRGALSMSDAALRENYARACAAFQSALGERPRASAAPGWQCGPRSLAALDELGLDYASDCRGEQAFYPCAQGRRFATLQLPTTLPTSDEWLGGEAALADHYLEQITRAPRQVLTVHAEAEGLLHAHWFAELLARLHERGVRVRTLGELAQEARASAPDVELELRALPGRAGLLACSGGSPQPAPGGHPAP